MKKQSLLILALCIGMMADVHAQPGWLWAKSTGGINDDHGNAVATDSYGNIFTAGGFTGSVDFDPGPATFYLNSITGSSAVFISKLDSLGNFAWAIALSGIGTNGGASASSMALDSAGNIYTTGNYFGMVDFDPGIGMYILTGGGAFISKLDASGNFVWAKQLDVSGNSSAIVLGPAGTGTVYTTGNFSGTADFDPGAGTVYLTSAGLNEDIYISKLDSLGNFVWAKIMGGTGNDMGTSMDIDDAGRIYSTGKFQGTSDFDPGIGTFNLLSAGDYDIFIACLNDSGDFVWAKSMGGTGADEGWSLAVDPSGRHVCTTGRFEGSADFDPGGATFNLSIPGNYSIFISQLDHAGNFSWAQGIGGAGYDVGRSVAMDASGNVFTTGNFAGTIDFDPNAGTYFLSANAVDVFISKLDSAGNFVWAKAAGGVGYEYGEAITVASETVLVTGYFSSPFLAFGTATVPCAGGFDVFVAKIDQLVTGLTSVEPSKNGTLKLYPNPADKYVVLSFEQYHQEVSIYISDLAGKIIFRDRVTNTTRIELNTTEFAEGIYLVNMQAGDLMETRKFVVTR